MIKGDEIVRGKRVRDVLHTPQLGYVYNNGIYNTVNRKGRSTFRITLEKDMVLCAKLPNENRYFKLWVASLSSTAAFITAQDFPNCVPGSKFPIWPTSTMYCDLKARKLNAAADTGHIRVSKSTRNSATTYTLEAKNGVEIGEFTGTSDFTAGNGTGPLDPEMVYI